MRRNIIRKVTTPKPATHQTKPTPLPEDRIRLTGPVHQKTEVETKSTAGGANAPEGSTDWRAKLKARVAAIEKCVTR